MWMNFHEIVATDRPCDMQQRNSQSVFFTARGSIAIVSRPSVRPSVTLRYRGRICSVSSKVITRKISLGSSLLGATASAI